MHRPPACAWKAGVAQWQRRLLAFLVGLGLLDLLGFGLRQGWGPVTLLLFVILLVCGAAAVYGLRGNAIGQLRWDGENWHWSGQGDSAVTEISCVMDLQRLLLLRIRCDHGSSHWLWLESRTMDSGWRALRRAVVASKDIDGSAKSNSLP